MSPLTDLALTIVVEAKRLADYLDENNLPQPSFGIEGPPRLPLPTHDLEIRTSQGRLYESLQKLSALTLGPVEHLRWQAMDQFNDNMSLQAILRFGIADAVPSAPSSTTTFAAVAIICGIPEALVARLVRHAAIYHVFREPVPHHVAHTCASLALRNGETERDWHDMIFEEWAPAAVCSVDAMQQYPGSAQEPEETAFGMAFGGKSIYRYLDERPERARVFGSAMKSLGQGSHGHASIAIARQAPELKFVVQDLPSTAEYGRKILDPALADRISFLAHDMNDVQPVVGADIYLFRHVFPNWSKKYCVKFLKNLVPALTPDAKVLLSEGCLVEPGVLPYWEEKYLRGLDLCMTCLFSGNERTEEEWREIFALTDERFKFLGCKHLAEATVSFLFEAIWDP
ncbi:putative o- protein [Neofusicoccum parvum UCRNP2]|uniref:Putative o-protein n=1 Tax=Botryosphaeria parva (strain UCR-NP2) TaxID=1287680 RepID=R1E9S7_BOTPV|nr:putative o- protein [Neofusicoccum parvum UCRNP2]